MENKYKIQFEWSAKQELKKIHFYIKHILLEPRIAGKIIKNISGSIMILKHYPEAFSKIGNLSQIRRFIVKNYNIIYSINKNQKIVYILHIYHKAQKY